jgi:hypothetical protein
MKDLEAKKSKIKSFMYIYVYIFLHFPVMEIKCNEKKMTAYDQQKGKNLQSSTHSNHVN